MNEETAPNPAENSGNQPTGPQAPPPAGTHYGTVVIITVVLVVTAMLMGGKYLARSGGNATPSLPSGLSLKGAAAPEFQLTSLDGKTVKLSDLRGKAVVLNFWATWCGPCKIEIPWLADLQKQYQSQGVEIVGVAMDDDAEKNKADIAKFAKEMNVNYEVLLGNDKIADAYGGVDALPTTFYIGRDGKIVNRIFGIVGHKEIEENIQAALKEGQGNSGQ